MHFARLLREIAILGVAALAVNDGVAQELLRVEAATRSVTDSITGLPLQVSTSAFWLARTELTQGDFELHSGTNPSRFRGKERPVENITWQQAIAYCNRRSAAEGFSLCYPADGTWDRTCTGYRLPTEAEWMAAAGQIESVPEIRLKDAELYRGPMTVSTLASRAGAGTRAASLATAVSMPKPETSQSQFADLWGNVWELCWDRFSASPIVDAVMNPEGPQTGDARVIRGGSFLTQASQWNKGFRSSQEPAVRSPYVGFRIARGILPAMPAVSPSEVPGLHTVDSAEASRSPDAERIRARWMRVLGRPDLPGQQVAATVLHTIVEPAWSGRLLELQVERGHPWRALLVLPAHAANRKLPVVIIPYYDVDTPAGKNLGGRNSLPSGVRAFAHLAAQHGMASIVVRWAGENDGPGYLEVVAGLAERHPGVTGLGYWVWQAQRLSDWLAAQPEVDAARIGILGHSLGGKMALYAAAFEPRIKAVVSSEPGIALAFSNYGDPWYFGERLALLPEGADQHELLQLIAPRPFLLVAGESADGDKSLPVLQRAAPAYAALGGRGALQILNHRSGHSPTPASAVAAIAWLHARLREQ